MAGPPSLLTSPAQWSVTTKPCWPPQALPLLVQPVGPIIARVVKQPLAAPEPAHAVRHGPLRPPPLAHWVRAYPLAQVHLHRVRQADDPNQPCHPGLGWHIDNRGPDRPTMMPIPVRLFDRHPPSILCHRLRDPRCGGEQEPGVGVAMGHGAAWRRL